MLRMKRNWHFYVSIIKSVIRIIACIVAMMQREVYPLALGFFFAELLGIVEEAFEKE